MKIDEKFMQFEVIHRKSVSTGDFGFSTKSEFSNTKHQNLEICPGTFSICPKIQISKKSENPDFGLYVGVGGMAAGP